MRGESHADTSGTRARLPANTKKQAKVASRPQSTAAKARRSRAASAAATVATAAATGTMRNTANRVRANSSP